MGVSDAWPYPGFMIDPHELRYNWVADETRGLARYGADVRGPYYPRAWNVTPEGDWIQNGWLAYLEAKLMFDARDLSYGYLMLLVIRDPGNRYAMWMFPEGWWADKRSDLLGFADWISAKGWPRGVRVREGWNRSVIRENFLAHGKYLSGLV